MSDSANAKSIYLEIMQYIEDARAITDRGEFVELQNLDKRVAQLCEAVQNLSVEDSMAMKDELQRMMNELTELQATFVEKRAGLAKEITEMGKHKQAALAYKQQEAASVKEAVAQAKSIDGGE